MYFHLNTDVYIYDKLVSGILQIDEKPFERVDKGKVVLLSPIFDSGLIYVFDSWN